MRGGINYIRYAFAGDHLAREVKLAFPGRVMEERQVSNVVY